MGHSYNHGLVTSSKGLAIEFVKITGLNDATQTVDDGDSGIITSCTKGATGVYTITFAKPRPPKILVCMPSISSVSATTDLIHARWTDNDYNATTGVMTIHLVNDDDAGAGVAVDGASTNILNLVLVFNRYKNL